MRNVNAILLILFSVMSCTRPAEKSPVDWVDTQLGTTHCRWFFYTPAALPFGMAKLAPTTNAYGSVGSWLPNGYDDRHTSIEGFAHLHEFQIGGIVTMPTIGNLKTLPGTLDNPGSGYRSRFEKFTEQAVPGFYGVTLADYGIKVELTASERVGFHRYTYPQADTARVLFDIGHPQGESAEVVDTHISYDPSERALKGFLECYPVYATFCDKGNTVKSYFYARLPEKITSFGTYRDSVAYPGSMQISGQGTGMYIEFPTMAGEVVEMQVGLSYTSVENARMNLEKETAGKCFDEVKENARRVWNEKLSRIEVEGGKDADKIKFYTALYHALLGRGVSNDVDGSYITHSKKIAKIPCDEDGIPLYSHHNTDGIWGGFWNLTQVWTLAYPEIMESYVRSTLDFSKDTGGWLHDGEAAGVYTNGVQTNFQGLIAAAAFHSGVFQGDSEELWKVVYQNEMGYEGRPDGAGRYDNVEFVKRGYVPLHDYTLPNGWVTNFGASHTLEYCFAAYAASQLAESLGKKEEAAELKRYAEGYKRLFDKETGYIRPREESGKFMKEFDPMKAWLGFQEGNAAQYTWYVPHDVAGLLALVGKEEFNRRLEKTFETASENLYGGKIGEFDSFSGVEQLYNHGNQPCLHNAWLFNYSGKPWLTQKYTRDICNVFYGTEPTHGYGYGQDEDQGQLGAWYVLAAMGLFDVQGGTNKVPTMQIGSPLFDKVTIHLNRKYYRGDTFIIKTYANSEKAYYVQDAAFNGKSLQKCFIGLKDIQKGGILELTMSEKANERWGIMEIPPSMSDSILK